MAKIILYHGTSDEVVNPIFGGGNDRHDYGRGFYLTENIDLAKEWAVCRPNEKNGFVHQYELDCEELKILDFQEKTVLSWLAELVTKIPINFLKKAYYGLHDLELELAVQKVGKV